MLHTLKSILARPAHSAALFVEIAIVTVIGWMAIEPVAVDTSIAMLPAGYDADRLVMISISQLSKESEEFDSALWNAKEIHSGKEQLLRMVKAREGTASATFSSWTSMGRNSYSTSNIDADSIYRNPGDPEDENCIQFYKVTYASGTDFFRTFGIKDLHGHQFEEPTTTPDSRIITRTLAQAISPDGKVTGKDLFPYDEEDEDDSHSPIAAVCEDITYAKGKGRSAIAFQPVEMNTRNNGYFDAITVRIADGVSPDSFMERLNADLNDLRCGNLYLTEPALYTDMQKELFAEKQKELTQKWIILGFFLINVFLGIAGTFYVQCRTRIPDAGVMRAFGATRSRIELGIVGEACLTVLIGWAVGSLLHLIYLHHQGLPMETDAGHVIQTIRPLWHDTRLGRYSVVGGIVLLFLLMTATLGACLPARRVGRTPVVDSLRDE